MGTLTRRQSLKASGALLAAPLLGVTGSGLLAQTVAKPRKSNALALPTFRYSTDLGMYCRDHVAGTLGNLKTGRATGSHLLQTSRVVRMFANHIDEIGLDPVFRVLAAHMSMTDDHSQSDFADQAYLVRKQNEPNLSRADFDQTLRLQTGTAQLTKKLTMDYGLSQHYHFAADLLAMAGHQHGAALVSWDPGHVRHRTQLIYASEKARAGQTHTNAIYDPSHPATLVRSSSLPGICKKVFCFVLGNPYTGGYIGGLITNFLAPYAGELAAGICASDAIASGIADILSAGAALIATPLEVEICSAAIASAALLTSSGGSALGAIVGGVIAQIVADSDC